MAMTKEELLRKKMEGQNKSAFDLGEKPMVETRAPEPVEDNGQLVARERKQKRVQILTYESLIERMDAYAKRQNRSRAEVFEAAVSTYLDKFE